jgi:hypothetical protein
MSPAKSNDERCEAPLTVETMLIGRHLWFRRRGDGAEGSPVGRGCAGVWVRTDGEGVEQT